MGWGTCGKKVDFVCCPREGKVIVSISTWSGGDVGSGW